MHTFTLTLTLTRTRSRHITYTHAFPLLCSEHFLGSVEPWHIWIEDSENEHIYHTEYFLLHKKQKDEQQQLVFTIPIFEPLPSQYYVCVFCCFFFSFIIAILPSLLLLSPLSSSSYRYTPFLIVGWELRLSSPSLSNISFYHFNIHHILNCWT